MSATCHICGRPHDHRAPNPEGDGHCPATHAGGASCLWGLITRLRRQNANLTKQLDQATLALGKLVMSGRPPWRDWPAEMTRRIMRARPGPIDQCSALNPDGSRCLDDGFQGWHLCRTHLIGGPVPFVEEIAEQSPIQQPRGCCPYCGILNPLYSEGQCQSCGEPSK